MSAPITWIVLYALPNKRENDCVCIYLVIRKRTKYTPRKVKNTYDNLKITHSYLTKLAITPCQHLAV